MASTPINSHRRSIVSKMTSTSIRVGQQQPTSPTSSPISNSSNTTTTESTNSSTSTNNTSNKGSWPAINNKKPTLSKLDIGNNNRDTVHMHRPSSEKKGNGL